MNDETMMEMADGIADDEYLSQKELDEQMESRPGVPCDCTHTSIEVSNGREYRQCQDCGFSWPVSTHPASG